MSSYESVRDNIILTSKRGIYNRAFIVSAYAGVTDRLLEHKKSGVPGVYGLFAGGIKDTSWEKEIDKVEQLLISINHKLFCDPWMLSLANRFIRERLDNAKECLLHLKRVCQHGHFNLSDHLDAVREMLASIGEAHSAWNTAHLLKKDGVNAIFIDLTGWKSDDLVSLDDRIVGEFSQVDFDSQLPIVTGYANCKEGLMRSFDRGYSEMTFSRAAVLSSAKEAVIHKEFHLSSADPKIVGSDVAVPIGRTNYDVADQLANIGMEAIHPKAAKGLRKKGIPLRVKNTFEPDHCGTLINNSYISDSPCVEIIAGCKGVYAFQIFDQEIAEDQAYYEKEVLKVIKENGARILSKDCNANSLAYYLSANLKSVKKIVNSLSINFSGAEIDQKKVAIVSVIGSDLDLEDGVLSAVKSLSDSGVRILSILQSMRKVLLQFVVSESDYGKAIVSLHESLVEIHKHGKAICLAS